MAIAETAQTITDISAAWNLRMRRPGGIENMRPVPVCEQIDGGEGRYRKSEQGSSSSRSTHSA